jgi:hypothetical protein
MRADRNTRTSALTNSSRYATFALAVAGVVAVLTGCAAPAAEPVAVEEETEAPPVSYPVPEGCPSGEEFGTAFVSDADWAEEIDIALLDTALATPLPDGGCGYVVGDGGATDSGVAFERIIVFYFNIDTPGRATHDDLYNWALAAGGVPATTDTGETSDTSIELPTEFSTFTNASFGWVDGETSSWFPDDETIPAFTQGASAQVEFYLPADAVSAMKDASAAGVDASDPTKALAAGLPLTSSVAFNAADPDGYTAEYKLTAKLQPFTTDVTNSAPGELEILSSASTTGVVKNTTPQRNTKTASVNAFALYPKGSAVCNSFNAVSIKDADWQDSSYCMIGLGGIGGADLAPDGTQTLESGTVGLKYGPFPEGGPELAVFNAPIAVYASLDPISMRTTTNWTSDKGCLTNLSTTSAWVIAMDGWPDPICQP